MKSLKKFIFKLRPFWIFLYFGPYMVWFMQLEKQRPVKFWVHSKLDDIIPFNEYFIIPYFAWFGYVALVVLMLFVNPKYLKFYKEGHPLYNLFKNNDEEDYYKCCELLMLGMTTALFVFTFFNSGQDLRPEVLPLNDVFSKAVANLYSFDTSTNVFPSLHVYNAVVVTYSFWTCNLINTLKEPLRSILKGFSLHLCIMIILSTVFLKQHSVLDIYGAFGMFAIMYLLDVRLFHKKTQKTTKAKENSAEVNG